MEGSEIKDVLSLTRSVCEIPARFHRTINYTQTVQACIFHWGAISIPGKVKLLLFVKSPPTFVLVLSPEMYLCLPRMCSSIRGKVRHRKANSSSQDKKPLVGHREAHFSCFFREEEDGMLLSSLSGNTLNTVSAEEGCSESQGAWGQVPRASWVRSKKSICYFPSGAGHWGSAEMPR